MDALTVQIPTVVEGIDYETINLDPTKHCFVEGRQPDTCWSCGGSEAEHRD